MDLDDTHTNGHPLDTTVGLGENGHTRRNPAWGDVEYVPLPPPRKSLWSRLMSTRPVRNIADYAQVEKRPVPAWVPTAIISISLLLIGGFGEYKSWRGEVNNKLGSLDDVTKLRLEVAELRGQIKDKEEISSYVQVINAYEVKLRETLLPITLRYGVKLPPMPPPPRALKHNQENEEQGDNR